MSDLLDEIKERLDKENRSVRALYAELVQYAEVMYLTNTFSRDSVIAMCSNLIKMYELRK